MASDEIVYTAQVDVVEINFGGSDNVLSTHDSGNSNPAESFTVLSKPDSGNTNPAKIFTSPSTYYSGNTNLAQRFTVLTKDDIQRRQEVDITKVSTVLPVSKFLTTVLLLHYDWIVSNVENAWFSDEEKVRQTVGLFQEPTVKGTAISEKISCGICLENFTRGKMHAVACGHPFCKSCWEKYLTASIQEGPGCLTLRCPEPKCGCAVGQDTIDGFVSLTDKEKYSGYLVRSYVENKYNIKWCPAPGCDFAVEHDEGSSYDVSCNCTHSFCWKCIDDAHSPVDCKTVAMWMLKNGDESETVNWMLAHTKPCPKCNRGNREKIGL